MKLVNLPGVAHHSLPPVFLGDEEEGNLGLLPQPPRDQPCADQEAEEGDEPLAVARHAGVQGGVPVRPDERVVVRDVSSRAFDLMPIVQKSVTNVVGPHPGGLNRHVAGIENPDLLGVEREPA